MKKSFLTLLIGILMCLSGFSQQTITIGESTSSSSSCILPGYYGFHYSAVMYSLEDLEGLTSGASITSIAYEVTSASTTSGSTIKVYMYEADELSSSSSWASLKQNATLVYDGSVGTITSNAWHTITLTTPYTYGGNNLIVLIEGSACSSAGGCSVSIKYATSDDAYVVLADNDSPTDSYSLDEYSSYYTVKKFKPNTQITFTGGTGSVCYSPSGLKVDNATNNSLTVSWNAVDNSTGYQYQYKTTDQEWTNLTSADTYSTTNTSVTISNLAENTGYDVRVRSICSDGNSIWKTLSTKTTCLSITSTDLPFTTSFEDDEVGEAPECWTVLQSVAYTDYYGVTSVYPYVYQDEYGYGDGPYTGENCLYFYKNNTITLPGYTGDVSQLQLSFYSVAASKSATDFIEIGIMTDLADSTTYTPIDTILTTEYETDQYGYSLVYKESTIPFTNYITSDDVETYYVVIKTVMASYYNYWFIDDLKLDITPDCSKATNVTVDSLGVYGISLSWTQEGDNTDWTIYYKEVNDTTNDYTQVEVSDTPSTIIDNLEPQTDYTLFVKTNCGNNPASSNAITFKTLCDVAVVDDENYWFDDFSDNAYCWTLPTEEYYYYWYVSSTSGVLQSSSYHSTSAITPVLNISSATTPFLKLSYSSTTPMSVYYRTSEEGDWVFINELAVATTQTTDSMALPNPSTTYQIKFTNSTNTISGTNAIYEIKVYNEENPPSCGKPYNVVANANPTSATITWQQPDNTENWIVYYKESTTESYSSSDEIADTTYTLTTTPNTSYDVYVVAVCGNDESSYPSSNVYTFTTPCTGILAEELPKTWDFDSTDNVVLYSSSYSTYAIPSCWSHIGTFSQTYIYNNSNYATYSYSGNSCLYITKNALAIMPLVDNASIDLSNMQISFYSRVLYSYNDCSLTVGIITNPNDSNTFIPITTITPPASYELFEIPLVYEGQGAAYIAFKGKGGALIDDLTLDFAPQCTKPSNLATSDLNPNGCTLTWNQAGTTSQWRVYYKQQDATAYDSTGIVTEKSYTFTNLETNTIYDIYVKALCSDTSSADSKTTSVTIPCLPLTIADLPYSTDFEDVEEYAIPSCWTVTKKSSSPSYPSIVSSTEYANSGTKYLNMYNECSIALNGYQGNINELQLSLSARPYATSYYYGSLIVGIMTDLTDMSTFTAIDTFDAESWSGAVYEAIDVPFNSYQLDENVTTYYVVLKTIDIDYGAWRIDDLTLKEKPDCAKATNLTVDSTTSTSANISWTQSDDNASWIVYYKKSSDTTYSQVTVNDTPTAELTELEPITSYDVYVSTQCGDNSPSSITITFRTDCPEENTTLTEDSPYVEDFESYNNDELPGCWTIVKSDPVYEIGVKIESSDSYDYAYSGTRGFRIIASGSCNKPIVALREFANDLTDLRVQFYYRAESTTSGNLELGYITDATNSETFTSLYAIEPNDEWSFFSIDLNAFADQLSEVENPRLALRQNTNISSSWYYYLVDSLSISLSPACTSPSNIVISSSKDTTIINWYSSASSFNITIKDEQGSTVVEESNLADNSFSTTELSYSTTYTLSITGICTDGSTTEATTLSFTTACASLTEDDLPKTWDFESDFYTIGYNEFPQCWTINGNYPTINENSSTGDHYLYFSGYGGAMYTALPHIDVSNIPLNTLQITFEAAKSEYTTSSTLYVGVMTDPNDGSTFTSIKSFDLTSTYASYSASFASYQGEGEYIAFYVNNEYVYMDDVLLEKIPACPKPSNVNISNITSSSATVSWTQSDTSVSSWIVNYKEADATSWDTIQTNTTTITLTDLQPATTYAVRIEAVCSAGDNPFSLTQTFATPCATIVVTNTTAWEEDFSSEDALTCWTMSEDWTLSGNKLYHSSYYYSADPDDAISPILDISNVNAPAVTFTYSLEAYESDYVNTLTVLYRTSSNDAWIELKSYDTVADALIDTIALPEKSATYQLNFRWSNYADYAEGISVDDLKVFNNSSDTTTPTAPCDAPTALTASNIAQTSATITWTGTATSYDVQLNNNDIENVTTNSKQLTGLTSNTTYTVKVRSNCGTATSDWVTTTFTTLSDEPTPCNKPTDLEVVATSNSLTLSWSGDAASYDVQLNDESIQTTAQTLFTFANLTPSTTYNLKVRANCGETTSEWATITGTTNAEDTEEKDPVVTTTSATATETTATLNAVVSANNNTITASGFKYRLSGATEWTNDVEATIQTSGLMSAEISNLTPNTDYEYKAYVVTDKGATFEGAVKQFTTQPSSLIDVENTVNVLTYPNPTTANATLEIKGLTEDANVIVTDVNGRVVIKDIYVANQSSITISTENLSAGVYYIKVTNAVMTKTQTLIKK